MKRMKKRGPHVLDDLNDLLISLQNCRQTGVRWLKWTNLQFSCCNIFVIFRNNPDIILHCDKTPFWISDDINKDDLE